MNELLIVLIWISTVIALTSLWIGVYLIFGNIRFFQTTPISSSGRWYGGILVSLGIIILLEIYQLATLFIGFFFLEYWMWLFLIYSFVRFLHTFHSPQRALHSIHTILPISLGLYFLLPQIGLVKHMTSMVSWQLFMPTHMVFIFYILSYGLAIVYIIFQILPIVYRAKTKEIYILWGISFAFLWYVLMIYTGFYTNQLVVFQYICFWGIALALVTSIYLFLKYQLFGISSIRLQIFLLWGLVIVEIGTLAEVIIITQEISIMRLVMTIISFIFVFLVFQRRLLAEKYHQTITQSNAELSREIAIEDQFLQIASHQLRTPLSVIKGYLFELSLKNEPNSKKLLENMKAVSNTIDSIVSEVLSMNTIQAKGIQLNPLQETSITQIITDIIEQKKIVAEKKGIEITIESIGKRLSIPVDVIKIREAITNIIDNAIQYGKSQVVITIKSKKDKVMISIQDDGIGIAKEDFHKLFKPYGRGKNSKALRQDGTGLGLYLSQMIIQAHRGEIELISEGEKQGTICVITLPRGEV